MHVVKDVGLDTSEIPCLSASTQENSGKFRGINNM